MTPAIRLRDTGKPRLSVYGEPPTEADIEPAHPDAPPTRPLLRWRLMNRGERRRILGHD